MGSALTRRQQMFVFSMFSELGAGIQGTAASAILRDTLNRELVRIAPEIGVWDLVWGPGVYLVTPDSLPANVMFAVHSAADSQVVVALAGTNPSLVFDWFAEDWFIYWTSRWDYGDAPPEEALISQGSQVALSLFQAMRPVRGLPAAGRTLAGFLRSKLSEWDEDVEIITTGHSLGGAVSPALALWLRDTQAEWDPQGRATISNWAYAGPTTGNKAFAEYAGRRLVDAIHRVANSLDISPLGWNGADLEKAKTIYTPWIPEDYQVVRFLGLMQKEAKVTDYSHVDPDAEPLGGSVKTSLINPFASSYTNYHVQQGYQHLEAYFPLLDIPQYAGLAAIVRAALGPLGLANSQAKANLVGLRAAVSR